MKTIENSRFLHHSHPSLQKSTEHGKCRSFNRKTGKENIKNIKENISLTTAKCVFVGLKD